MKNWIALGFGLAMIGAALVLALGTTDPSNGTWPQEARVFATELHVTPSSVPTRTPMPTPTPVPVHITSFEPQAQEVLELLFHYPYQGAAVVTTNAHVSIEPFQLGDGRPRLIVTGDRLEGGRGMHVASGAFGAMLARENGEYLVKFLRVAWGHGYMQVAASTSFAGEIIFSFSRLNPSSDADTLQRLVILQPCGPPVRESLFRAMERRDDLREWHCF